MTSFHSITGHLFNRNVSKEELDKSDSLLSTLKQQPNLNISAVWTIDSKQEKKLKKLNAMAQKMLNYRGSSEAKRERIVKLTGDIRLVNRKLSETGSTPNRSPKASFTPSSIPVHSNRERSRLDEKSSTSVARSSLERAKPSRYESQQLRATPKPMGNIALGAAGQTKLITPKSTVTNSLTKLQSELNRKKAHYAFMKDQAQGSTQGYRDFMKEKDTLKQEIQALERRLVVAKAGLTSLSGTTVSKSPQATSRATQITDTNGTQNKIAKLNTKIVAKTNERRRLESDAQEGGWKEASRLKPKIRELKDEISALLQELQTLQRSLN